MPTTELGIPRIPGALIANIPAHFGVPEQPREGGNYPNSVHYQARDRATEVLRKMHGAPSPKYGRSLEKILFVEDLSWKLLDLDLILQGNFIDGLLRPPRYREANLRFIHTIGAAVVVEALATLSDDGIFSRLDRIGQKDQARIRKMLSNSRYLYPKTTIIAAESQTPSVPKEEQSALFNAVDAVAAIFMDNRPIARMGAGITYQAFNMVWSRLNGSLPFYGPDKTMGSAGQLTVSDVIGSTS